MEIPDPKIGLAELGAIESERVLRLEGGAILLVRAVAGVVGAVTAECHFVNNRGVVVDEVPANRLAHRRVVSRENDVRVPEVVELRGHRDLLVDHRERHIALVLALHVVNLVRGIDGLAHHEFLGDREVPTVQLGKVRLYRRAVVAPFHALEDRRRVKEHADFACSAETEHFVFS